MIKLPEHYPIDVDAAGNGPVPDWERDHTACWCGDPDCRQWQEPS